MNTVCPSLAEVADHNISLLIGCLIYHRQIAKKLPPSLGLSLPHCMTWMNKGVVAHIRWGTGFAYEVGYPITKLVVTSRDKADLLAIQCMAYRECGVVTISVGGGRSLLCFHPH